MANTTTEYGTASLSATLVTASQMALCLVTLCTASSPRYVELWWYDANKVVGVRCKQTGQFHCPTSKVKLKELMFWKPMRSTICLILQSIFFIKLALLVFYNNLAFRLRRRIYFQSLFYPLMGGISKVPFLVKELRKELSWL